MEQKMTTRIFENAIGLKNYVNCIKSQAGMTNLIVKSLWSDVMLEFRARLPRGEKLILILEIHIYKLTAMSSTTRMLF